MCLSESTLINSATEDAFVYTMGEILEWKEDSLPKSQKAEFQSLILIGFGLIIGLVLALSVLFLIEQTAVFLMSSATLALGAALGFFSRGYFTYEQSNSLKTSTKNEITTELNRFFDS